MNDDGLIQSGGDMPDRIIRERATESDTLKRLSDGSERAFWRATVKVDDYGRFNADPEAFLSRLFGKRPHGWTEKKMAAVLREWEEVGLAHLYRVDGDERIFGHFVTFLAYQRARDSKPKYPDPPCGNSQQLAARCGESLQSASCGNVPQPAAESRESRVESRESRKDHLPLPPPPTIDWIFALWNEKAPLELPRITEKSPGRREKATKAIRHKPDRAFWIGVMDEYGRSAFLRGERPSPAHPNFRPDFDWLLAKGKNGTENVVKVAEGKYRDEPPRHRPRPDAFPQAELEARRRAREEGP